MQLILKFHLYGNMISKSITINSTVGNLFSPKLSNETKKKTKRKIYLKNELCDLPIYFSLQNEKYLEDFDVTL